MRPTIRRNEFFSRALTWLRSQQSCSTNVLPDDAIDPEGTGCARVHGWLVRPCAASRWAFAGLYGLAIGVMLLMFNPRAADARTQDAVDRAGYTVTAGATVCIAVAEVVRRRNRTRMVVELRSRALRTTSESIDALRREYADAQLWTVTEQALEDDVAFWAAKKNVRCFSEGPRGFQEVLPCPDQKPGGLADK